MAGAVGAAVAVVVGLPALRARGLFLAVTTLAFATTSAYFLLNPTYAGWIPTGRIERPPLFGVIDLEDHGTMYRLCLVCLVLVILAVTGLRRSRTGRRPARPARERARRPGLRHQRHPGEAHRLRPLGLRAAVAGCLLVHVTRSFAVGSFTAVGVLRGVHRDGGRRARQHNRAPSLGALFARGGTWFLPESWQLLPSAIGVLLVLLVLPGGLSGLLFGLRDRWLRSVARRHGIVVPSLVADVAVDDGTVVSHAENRAEVEAAGSPPSPDPAVTEPSPHTHLPARPARGDRPAGVGPGRSAIPTPAPRGRRRSDRSWAGRGPRRWIRRRPPAGGGAGDRSGVGAGRDQ